MAGKLLIYGQEARDALQQGMDILAGAVKVTMGPRGRLVAFDKGWGAPAMTRDGVTVAREIGLGDPRHEAGVELLMQAATRTSDVAGDGTTTAIVLAHAIVTEGLKAVAAGVNPILLQRGLQAATDAVVAALRAAALPMTGRQSIAQVATIAAADPAIGELVAAVMEKVGRDGLVTVEDGRRIQTEVEYVQGMQLDRGYVSSSFVTDGARMEAVVEDPYVLVTDKRLSKVADVLHVLAVIAGSDRRELLIVAEDVEGDALATLVLNKQRGVVNVVAIRAPNVGERRKDLLRDIAIVTGALVVSDETGRRLEDVRLEDLGDCTRVIARRDDAVIVGGQGDPVAIRARIAQLKAARETTTYFYDRERLRERVARLSSGVAIIRPGAGSEVEMKEKKARVENALAAARAAYEEGIVPGGGVANLDAIAALDAIQLRGDAAIGVTILRRALEEPMRQIATNAGANGSVVVAEVRRHQDRHASKTWGFDAMAGQYVDLVVAGIVDPARVTRLALENASSVARMILTTEVLIVEKPGDEKNATCRGIASPAFSR
jgi:chaperonin GroEL